MKEQIFKLLKTKNLVISSYLIKVAIEKELSLNEFLVLAYFDNSFSNKFDVELVSETIGLDNNQVLESFNSLMLKGLVSLDSVKDKINSISEEVNLDGFYDLILDHVVALEKEDKEKDIFKTFESELGRPISSMELELINKWLDFGTPEEIILGALREAVYNGVSNFRYIDKIIYEWEKKGFKTMDDVNTYIKNRREEKSKDKATSKKEQEISDFDWLSE
jgi:DNA replication protein